MQYDSPESKPMMTIQESVKVCLRKYADFRGRATRAEFWCGPLAAVIAGLVLGAVDSFINVLAGGYAYSPFYTIFNLAILLPNLAVTARRLHDIGKTGWWQLVWLLLGAGAWLIFLVVVIFSLANYLIGEGWNVGEEEFRATLTFARFAPAIFGLTFGAKLQTGESHTPITIKELPGDILQGLPTAGGSSFVVVDCGCVWFPIAGVTGGSGGWRWCSATIVA